MAGLRQWKRVSWASDAKLCQVRLFLSDDAPAQSGLGTQDNLQAKTSWMLHASGTDVDDSLPPGFESPLPVYHIGVDISKIPVMKWKNPCKILLDVEWRVVAGEESEEASAQLQRELKILEHFYPQQSSIPPNPFVPSDVQDSKFDDTQTPPIPVLSIEDEDASDQFEVPLSVSTPAQLQQPNSRHAADLENLQGNAAYKAVLKSNEDGSTTDRSLLMNILNNPILVERLLAEHGPHKSTQLPTISIPLLRPTPDSSSVPPPAPPPVINTSTSQQGSIARPPPLYDLPNVVPPLISNAQPLPAMQVTVTHPGTASVKNINYYKSLIQQHGGDTQTVDSSSHASYHNNFGSTNNLDMMNIGVKQQTEMRPRTQKPCAFFNTPRGCRHGASCLFFHDSAAAPQVEHSKGSKRIKLDGAMGGRI